jgi:hypothetical protein
MATSDPKALATVVASAQQLIAGTAKHLGTGTQVTFLGGSYTAADLTTRLQQVVGAQSDVDTAKAATKVKLAARKTVMASARPFMGAYRTYIKAIYGNQPDVLADFGVNPKARTPQTVAVKAAAAAKRAATRTARGTKGTAQKKAIKGDVTGITITPTTASTPVAPAVTSSPTVGAPSTAPTASPAPHPAT